MSVDVADKEELLFNVPLSSDSEAGGDTPTSFSTLTSSSSSSSNNLFLSTPGGSSTTNLTNSTSTTSSPVNNPHNTPSCNNIVFNMKTTDDITSDSRSEIYSTLSLDPDMNPDEEEEKHRLISQVLELQNTLDDLSSRVDSVKEENLKLKSENQVLGQYIENLMAASSVFQSTSPAKAKKKSGPGGGGGNGVTELMAGDK